MSRSTSHSRLSASHSRPRASRSTSNNVPIDPTSMILSDGAVTEQTAELLHEFIHPHHQTEATLIEDVSDDELEAELEARSHLPWWKRPSPMWVLALMPISSIAFSATIAPRVEIYTQLACAAHNPEVYYGQDPDVLARQGLSRPSTPFIDSGGNSAYRNATLELVFDKVTEHAVEEPTRRAECASDPVVQAAVAKLAATMTATMGILACLTTAGWGSYSDRVGRTAVLGISVVGLLLTDFIFLLVFYFHESLPGGYWFLIVGPIAEGCLGGLACAIAAMHAYIADTTPQASRSRVFSLNLGLLFSGMAIGPTFGGLLIRLTGSILSVFYVATSVHTLYALVVWFIIPESLTQSQRRQSRAKHAHDLQGSGVAWSRLKPLLSFLTPLSVVMPEMTISSNPLKPTKRDWNLTLVGMAYACMLTLMGSYTYKFQYAASAFGWTSETIGYWLSLVGATRAIFLTAILPGIIKLFESKDEPSVGESETLLSPSTTDADEVSVRSNRFFHLAKHTSKFDLALARISLLIDALSYMLMGLSRHSGTFAVASVFGSLGTGFSPSLQSVALELYTQRGGTESGKLFGSLSVIQALSSQIIGPSLYGLIYVKTVSTVPQTMFYVGAGSILLSFLLLAGVRLAQPEHHPGDVEEVEPESARFGRQATLVDLSDHLDRTSIKFHSSSED